MLGETVNQDQPAPYFLFVWEPKTNRKTVIAKQEHSSVVFRPFVHSSPFINNSSGPVTNDYYDGVELTRSTLFVCIV